MRISDWSSDVCSSDLQPLRKAGVALRRGASRVEDVGEGVSEIGLEPRPNSDDGSAHHCRQNRIFHGGDAALVPLQDGDCFKEAFHRLVLFITYAGVVPPPRARPTRRTLSAQAPPFCNARPVPTERDRLASPQA